MHRLLLALVAALAAVAIGAGSVAAAPTQAAAKRRAGPFEGTFSGRVTSSDGSSAQLTVTLTHRGDVVKGTATIGDGLTVSAGWCGGGAVDAATASVEGTTEPGNARRVALTPTVEVQGISIPITFVAAAASSGKTLAGRAVVNVPGFCGAAPELSGTLTRVRG